MNRTTDQENEDRKANQLIHETSPYLLQHAYNPVDWQPWNSASLKKAVSQDKLLIISIGYSACHWCHVMEHESFEDSLVAVKMNANYVSVKVDREERPDVDQVYMNAAYLITGQGGWPLNAIALPDGRPVFAGTYFPRNQWIRILDHFSVLYRDEPEKLEEQAEKVTFGIRDMDFLPVQEQAHDLTMDMLDTVWNNWKPKIDYRLGGRSGAPKFMMPNNWEFLLRYHQLSGDEQALEAVTTTLRNMAYGGLYDHAGGGFARYSTDEHWLVPHFEKMLYDNAQLVSLYSRAFQLTKDPLYEQVVQETLAFIEREMTAVRGGFYSALDADSEGEEGKFYVWQAKELKALLGEDYAVFSDHYSVSERGNWEDGKNILHRKDEEDAVAARHGSSTEELRSALARARSTLMAARELRVRPGLDDKILTSWNALMIRGYTDSYIAFGDPAHLEAAVAGADFLRNNCLRKDGGLYRSHKDGRSTINAFLDDYALTADAFIALYQVTFDEAWLQAGLDLAEYAITHFTDSSTGMFFYTSDEDDALIARTKELSDNVISASNSIMARVLFMLGHYYYRQEFLDRSANMLRNVRPQVIKHGPFYANWATLMTELIQSPAEVAIVGDDALTLRKEFDRYYLPSVLFLGGRQEGGLSLLQGKRKKGETLIYVCYNKSCRFPVKTVKEALEQIKALDR